ncbi:hypothetical protein RFI_31913 [Reticulomyxa filosa]|uniref:Uncharacterized protein n=1 Tax=Reticulomyxa filosa TaxID=46433 RepID=X6LWH3_RETFI|nr:hypothetical protein RFI_31913 [Reticulomyxa filosa]|eukprot:ETO05482.1 hypothetical protein RFI_31913 [Reticulomyxa filosa]
MFLFSGPEDSEEESSGFPSDFDTDTVVEFVSHGTEMKEESKAEVDDNPETLLLGTVASEIIIISDDEEKEVKIKEEEENNDADDENEGENEDEEEETESESEETMLDKVLHGRDPEETGRQLMEARARFVNAFMNRRREHERDEAVQ